MDEYDALFLKGRWNVKGYKAGTVSMGESVTVQTDNGWFMGNPLETTNEPSFELWGNNLITAAGQALVGDMRRDAASYDTGLTYHAIGTTSTAVASGDTTLGGEAKRLALTSKSRSGNTLTYSTFYTATQSAVSVEEAGMFGHNTATSASNTGILFNHYLVHVGNASGLYDLTFNYNLQIGS